MLESLGFEKRVRDSHHLFRKDGVEERVNLQRGGANDEAVLSQTGPDCDSEVETGFRTMIEHEVIICGSEEDGPS